MKGRLGSKKKRLQGFCSEAAFPDAALKKQPRRSQRSALVFWQHSDNRHHAKVLVGEDVAVIDEVSNVHPTEVHQQLHVWERDIFLTDPERHLNHVRELPGNGWRLRVAIDLKVVLRLDQEVDLVHV